VIWIFTFPFWFWFWFWFLCRVFVDSFTSPFHGKTRENGRREIGSGP
jgi:hypothetical protein